MDWRHRSACLDEDPELFFPIGNTGPAILQIEEAKQVCRRCEVREQCLAWALEAGQDHGVWGGMSEDERRALKRRNARARVRDHRLTPADALSAPAPPGAPSSRPSGPAPISIEPPSSDSTSVRTIDSPRLADALQVEVGRQPDAVVADGDQPPGLLAVGGDRDVTRAPWGTRARRRSAPAR